MDKLINKCIIASCGFFFAPIIIFAELSIELSHQRGFYEQPFQVIVDVNESQATLRFTKNGKKPTAQIGQNYTQPIAINNSTILRLIAFTDTDTIEITHSYIFLSDIINTSYMSTHITNHQHYMAMMDSAFKSIPSIIIHTEEAIQVEDHINPDYVLATAEMAFPTKNKTGFYVPCGIKTWGGSPTNPKKNYRLSFKKEFGAGKLKYDVFNDGYPYPIEPVDQFDNLLLRAGSQDGLNAEFGNEADAQFIKNRFICDIAMEMGYPAPHGRFVHLFLNGTYAGNYHLMERPDKHFFQDYIFKDADKDDIEVKKNDEYWSLPNVDQPYYQTLLSYANGLNAKLNYEKMHDFININGAADYIILHQFMANFDWHDQQNTLLGAIPVNGTGPFEFVVWDVDFTLGSKGVISIGYEFNKHGAVPENLFEAAEFKFLQGDKVECLCKGEGILTPENLKAKYLYRAKQVEVSLIAEAARWGNTFYEFGEDFPNHKAVENWETAIHWKAEFDRIYDDFLTNRTGFFMDEYVNLGRYNTLNRMQAEVTLTNTIKLSHTNGFGVVVYMLNGEDPRQFGGEIHPDAKTFISLPITFEEPIELKARFYKNTSAGRQWSHMCPQKFYPQQNYQSLVINELHIQPKDTFMNSDTIKGKHFEFIELYNRGNQKLYLEDVAFSDGVDFTFKKMDTIAANGFVVLASDSLRFIKKYGFSPDGTYEGQLNNGGEALVINDPYGNTIDSVYYLTVNPWATLNDFNDTSLALLQPGFNNNQAEHWAIQSTLNTPGTTNAFCDTNFKLTASIADESCSGHQDGFIAPQVIGGTAPYGYAWSDGSTLFERTDLSKGDYTLTVSDQLGCTINQTFTIGESYQDCMPCPEISGLGYQNPTTGSAFVFWDAIPNASYIFYYKKQKEATWNRYEGRINFVILFDLSPCETYQLKVAQNCSDVNESAASEIVSFTTGGCKVNDIVEENNTLQIYPNPAEYNINVVLPGEALNVEKIILNIYNSTGKLIVSNKIEAKHKTLDLDVNNLTTGLYYVQFLIDDKTFTQKLKIY